MSRVFSAATSTRVGIGAKSSTGSTVRITVKDNWWLDPFAEDLLTRLEAGTAHGST